MPTVGFECERVVGAPSAEVRRAISETLRGLGFKITADQISRIQATRGNLIGLSLLLKDRMPVLAAFDIASSSTGTAVRIRLSDNVKSLAGKTWGVNRQYREIFEELQGRLDLALARLDPVAARSFVAPSFASRAVDMAAVEQLNALTGQVGAGAIETAARVLDKPIDTTPAAWKGVDSVTYRSRAGLAINSLAETQAHLGIAVMIASHPGSLPAELTRDIETLAGGVERLLNGAPGRAIEVDVPDAQIAAVEILRRQAQIRAALPLRTLHVCRDCRNEKITNPEYRRIASRNEKLGDIMAGVGATISTGGISPTFVLGQVFKLKRLEPEFVCSRCQGLDADERVVTFCPECGDLARDVVLALCPKCSFDYLSKIPPQPFWTPEPNA